MSQHTAAIVIVAMLAVECLTKFIELLSKAREYTAGQLALGTTGFIAGTVFLAYLSYILVS